MQNLKPESGLELGKRTRDRLETGNQKLRSERLRSKPGSETGSREAETGIQAGAGKSHESPAGDQKPGIEKRAEQVQTGI